MKNKKGWYDGRIYHTNKWGDILILDWANSNNVLVQFLNTGHIRKTTRGHIISGSLRDVEAYNLTPSVYGIGYVGNGPYSATNSKAANQRWRDMLRRCYEPNYQSRHPGYIGCSVEASWHNFQNFAQWYYSVAIDGQNYQLDKDLKIKGNRVYSPETCLLIPQRINVLLVQNKDYRGKYPIGVRACKTAVTTPFEARLKMGNGIYHTIGYYASSEKAFYAYKEAKERLVKQVAEKYKHLITNEAYQALLRFTVNIDD